MHKICKNSSKHLTMKIKFIDVDCTVSLTSPHHLPTLTYLSLTDCSTIQRSFWSEGSLKILRNWFSKTVINIDHIQKKLQKKLLLCNNNCSNLLMLRVLYNQSEAAQIRLIPPGNRNNKESVFFLIARNVTPNYFRLTNCGFLELLPQLLNII